MVLRHYGLGEQPFGVTPDPRYLYLSPTHREALASALYGVSSGRGFTALVARPGMGKTTLLFDFLQQMQGSARTVFLFQSQYNACDLLRSLLADLGIEEDGSDLVRMHQKLNDVLLKESSQGRLLVVVIDEAQNLEEPVLESLRLLSNFETPRAKLMHIMLAGQPQLAEKLASDRLLQLRQRISIISQLKPFDAEETRLYIHHRLQVAGYEFARPLFTKQAEAMIAKHTEGIPRNINNVCFNAMSLGCVAGQKTIDVDVIQEVLGDLDLNTEALSNVSRLAKPILSGPSLFPNKPATPLRRSWVLKLALPLVLLTALGSLTFAPKGTTPQYASAPARDNDQSKSATTKQNASDPTAPRAVVVLPNRSLSAITVEMVGKYDEVILAKIRNLNPQLTNPDHIEPGQTILIPPIENTSRTIEPPPGVVLPSAAVREKP